MLKLILTVTFATLFSYSFANDHNPAFMADSLRLKTLVDSLNKQIQKYGTSKEIIQVSRNGDVILQYLNFDQKFKFNFFELGNDTTAYAITKNESSFGIRLEVCDIRSHAARNTIQFITPSGDEKAFIFFTCFNDIDIKAIHRLILAIRNECVEVKDYLK